MICTSRDKVRLWASGIVSLDVTRVAIWFVTVAGHALKSKYDTKKQRNLHLYWSVRTAAAERFCREVSEIKSQAHVQGTSGRYVCVTRRNHPDSTCHRFNKAD